MTRVIVSGSRDWPTLEPVWTALSDVASEYDEWLPPNDRQRLARRTLVVVHGGCPTGADFMAHQWCISELLDAEVHRADWIKYGKYAGPLRNKEMVKAGADVALFFIKNNSRGATHTLELALQAGIETRVWRLP